MFDTLFGLFAASAEFKILAALALGLALGFFIQREMHKDERQAMDTYRSRCADLDGELNEVRRINTELEERVKGLAEERDELLAKNKELEERAKMLQRRADSWKRLAERGGRGEYTDAALDAFVQGRQ